jgi:hypothetical protein
MHSSIKKTKKNTNTSIIKKNKFSFKNVKKYDDKDNINNDNDNYSNNDSNNNDSKSFSIRFTSRKFLSQVKSVVKRGRKQKNIKQDVFAMYLSDILDELREGKTIYKKKLDKYIFNDSEIKCICPNIFHGSNLPDDCECDAIKPYTSQGKSGAIIHSIRCGNQHNILKIIKMTTYYMKMRIETNRYIFIELDNFSLQTLINTYVYNELPNNTINIINSGVCRKSNTLKGYNLLEEAELGNGLEFFTKLLSGLYDDDFNIKNEDNRYVFITNYLLQVICILGHLQSSKLEFFHGDYKSENVFVKKSNKNAIEFFTFKVFGKMIRVKNIGFVVLIADFDKSSFTLSEVFNPKKYRFIPPIKYKPLLHYSVNNIIKKYGDIDPDSRGTTKGVKFEKLFISYFTPRKKDPTLTVLRSAGVKIFRDFDAYTFFIRLLDNVRIRDYFMAKRFNVTIMSFMSPKFINALYSRPVKKISQNESAFIVVEILDEIKESMSSVFSDYYVETLSALNYRLFR